MFNVGLLMYELLSGHIMGMKGDYDKPNAEEIRMFFQTDIESKGTVGYQLHAEIEKIPNISRKEIDFLKMV